MNLRFEIYLPIPEEFLDFLLEGSVRNFKNDMGCLLMIIRDKILAINDYLFELEFNREEEMRTEKPAVD